MTEFQQNNQVVENQYNASKIIIGYTIEEHHAALQNEREQVRQDLKRVHSAEMQAQSYKVQALELKLREINSQLDDIRSSYANKIKELENANKELRTIKGQVSERLLTDAENELKSGNTHKARLLFKNVEESALRAIEKNKEVVANAAFQQGKICEGDYDYLDAKAHYLKAIELCPKNLEYARTGAKLLIKLETPKEAIELLERTICVITSTFGEYSLQVADILNNLGDAYRVLGDNEYALKVYEKALKISLVVGGTLHFEAAVSRTSASLILIARGQIDLAISYLEKALESNIVNYGKYSNQTAITYTNLGLAWNEKDLKISNEYLKKSLDIGKKVLGEKSPEVALRHVNLAGNYLRFDELELAKSHIKIGLTSTISIYGENHTSTAKARTILAGIYQRNAEITLAESEYMKALKIIDTLQGSYTDVEIATLGNLGNVYVKSSKFKKAVECLTKILKLIRETPYKENSTECVTLANLGYSYFKLNDIKNATQYTEEAIKLSEDYFGKNHANTVRIKNSLAAIQKTK